MGTTKAPLSKIWKTQTSENSLPKLKSLILFVGCCIFQTANGCFALHLLVEIRFSHFASFLIEKMGKQGKKDQTNLLQP